jgi:alpha/beta superfamily hydrolase
LSLRERPFGFTSGGFCLEGALHEGDGRLAAVVLHPHPQYGGDMHNHVVLAVCAAFAGGGATTLRFNFRGTGRSEGAFDNGRGEADDARAAVRAARDLRSEAEVVLVGYSFGAGVAAAVAAEDALRGLVLVSPPVAFMALPPLPDALETLVIAGDVDDIAPLEALQALAGSSRRVVAVAGVGHTWWPGLEQLSQELSNFVLSLTRTKPQNP